MPSVLVTGASRGIGRAIAERLSADGWSVAAVARSQPRTSPGAGRGRIASWRLDVRDRDAVDFVVGAAARELGGFDAVVNNAGIVAHTPIDDDDDTLWADVIQTNLTAAMYVTRAALKHLRNGGRIVNMSSVCGKFGVARMGAYCAAKHGLIGWTRALALELAPREITVNAICPGWVETDMAAESVRASAAEAGVTPDAYRAQAIAEVPLKRFLDPAEVADMVAYLLSPGARGVTGQALSICAGQTPF